MFYKIVDIKTIEETEQLYVLVHFWDAPANFQLGEPPILINDFFMSVFPELEVLERDADDNLITASGKKVKDKVKEDHKDPFKRKKINNNIPRFVENAIDRFVKRATEKNMRGELTDKAAKLSDNDTKGLKTKAIELLGKEKHVDI